MGYGFVIDQRRCIGCHACTVACKQENDVPLGDFRTWVKYTDKGTFPSVKRHFTVLRCNHCDEAPCVTICPVNALSKRPDAIVDLDRDACIGCRACMQACPYDALYLNEDRGVAEKCHYCAHRTEIGLEPACVNVCPTEAIVSGDVDDPNSRIATLIAEQETSQRKLEKGTKPRVWYVGALAESLVPARAAEPSAYLWSQRAPDDVAPPVVPGFEPTPDITTTLDVKHPAPWGAHVWWYLVTKNVAAGAALVAPWLALLGVRAGWPRDVAPEVVALVFLALTNALLVHDLGRPERFAKILLKPNTKSWLVRGAWVLIAFGVLAAASLGLRFGGWDVAADVVRFLNLPVAAMAAGYTAFLLAQCRGRDLWLERGLFTGLVLRAALLGACVATLLPAVGATRIDAARVLALLCATNAVVLLHERRRRPRTVDARKAQAIMWGALPMATPATLLASAAVLASGGAVLRALHVIAARPHLLDVLAVAVTCVALVVYERAFIRAGQAVPLS